MAYENTKWVKELPETGKLCPVCGEGILVDNSFTSKKGVKYESVKCNKCGMKWIKSKPRPKNGKIDKVLEALKIVNENIKVLNLKVDKLLDETHRPHQIHLEEAPRDKV